jgi:hypothetical protein
LSWTLTLTTTVVRYVDPSTGRVVKTVELPPRLGSVSPPPELPRDRIDALVDVVEALLDLGLDDELARILPPVPPWLRLVIPKPPRDPRAREEWRRAARRVLEQVTDPNVRLALLEWYLRDARQYVVSALREKGFAQAEAERAFDEVAGELVSRARVARTLSDLVQVERDASRIAELVEARLKKGGGKWAPASPS